MNRTEARQYLNGAHGTTYFNGEPVFELENIQATIEIRREEKQVGMDIDSKITGMAGTGSMTINHVYDRGIRNLLNEMKKGKDPRSVIETVIADPDAPGGQRESVSLHNVWFNSIDLVNLVNGETVQKNYDFGFTPTNSDLTEVIN